MDRNKAPEVTCVEEVIVCTQYILFVKKNARLSW